MIITISGDPGSGKSTIAKAVAKVIQYKHYSAGDFMRSIAEERGISLMELAIEAEKDDKIDKDIDKRTQNLAKKEDNFIIDSRIAFHFIPNSIKIFLKTDTKIAAERILRDLKNNKRKNEKVQKTFEQVFKSVRGRQESERKRYKKYYGIDSLDMNNYDFVLDATNLNIEEETNEVLAYLKTRLN